MAPASEGPRTCQPISFRLGLGEARSNAWPATRSARNGNEQMRETHIWYNIVFK